METAEQWQNDVLRFTTNLEKGAVSAYVGAVPSFKDRDLSKAAASILGDEAMHWAVLRQAVGEDPVLIRDVASLGDLALERVARGASDLGTPNPGNPRHRFLREIFIVTDRGSSAAP